MKSVYLTKNTYVYDLLRTGILSGEYAPCQRLILRDLAESLNTSIMPIRESLKQLEKDGLVKQEPHQGYTVSPLSTAEIEELFTLRVCLESLSVKLAVEKCSPELIQKLRGNVRDMANYIAEGRQTRAQDGKDPKSMNNRLHFMQVNREFHLTVASISGYQHLPGFLNKLFDMSERYMNLLEFVIGLYDVDVAEHREIVDMIERGDAEAAVEKTNGHILRVMTELQEYAQKSGWIESGQAQPAAAK